MTDLGTPVLPPARSERRLLAVPVLSRLDHPVVPAFAAALGGVAFVVLRLAVVAKGDATRFVMAGRDFVNPAGAPLGLHVFPGSGYDGQFYYRLALDPAVLAKTAFGITLDAGFRLQRIGLSVVSWLASGGQHALVPDAMIAVNVAALVVLAYLGGLMAHEAGRHAAWGLLVAGYWGFLFSIGRDLPEVLASCFLVASLLALRRHRPIVGGCMLACAVLTLETTLDVAIALGLLSVAQVLFRRRSFDRRDAAWIVPGAAFVVWQLVVDAATGSLPMRSDGGDNLAAPLVNPIGSTVHYLLHPASASTLAWLGELFVLFVVVAYAAWSLLGSKVPPWEKLAWGISLLVAISLSHDIWYGKANFRGFEDLYVLSTLVLLGSRRRLWIPAVVVGVAWAVTFGRYVVAL